MRNKKKLLIVIGVLLVVLGGAAFALLKKGKADPPVAKQTTQAQTPPSQPAAKKSLRIIAAGDMLPHDSINQAAKAGGSYDYLQFMKNFQPYFQKADVRFCVQAVPGGGEAFGISGYPVFNAPVEFTRDMGKLGCNVIDTGTNHTNDKGQPLINATLDEWAKQPDILATAGANHSAEEQKKIRYFTKDGVKFALLSYVTYNNTSNGTPYGVNMFNEATAARELAEARRNSDLIIVSMRWGTEYSPQINGRQAQLSAFLADNGADLVFGHGQHVQGPVKKLPKKGGGETVVWYGIGNFISAQLEPEALFNGIPVVDVDIASKKITDLKFLPFYMHYEWTPEQKAREDLRSRKNYMMYTLDQAEEPLKRSQNNTSVKAQTDRLQAVLNQSTKVTLIGPSQY
jgi:hypothetical protein